MDIAVVTERMSNHTLGRCLIPQIGITSLPTVIAIRLQVQQAIVQETTQVMPTTMELVIQSILVLAEDNIITIVMEIKLMFQSVICGKR